MDFDALEAKIRGSNLKGMYRETNITPEEALELLALARSGPVEFTGTTFPSWKAAAEYWFESREALVEEWKEAHTEVFKADQFMGRHVRLPTEPWPEGKTSVDALIDHANATRLRAEKAEVEADELGRELDQETALCDQMAAALRSCNVVNPVLMPVNEHTEKIWESVVNMRPSEKRYHGETMTGAQVKAVRDALLVYEEARKS